MISMLLAWVAAPPLVVVAGEVAPFDWRAPLATVLGGIAVAYLGYRQARSVARTQAGIEARKVEAGAFARAKEIYEAGIDELQEQVNRLRARLDEEREDAGALRARLREMEQIVREMEDQIRDMRRRLALAEVSSSGEAPSDAQSGQ